MQINVTLKFADGTTEAISRPARKTQDGLLAVVYSQAGYIVSPDFSVDVTAPSVPKDSLGHIRTERDIRFGPIIDLSWPERYFFETGKDIRGRSRKYFAFDGSDSYARRLEKKFKEVGLIRAALVKTSTRPAKNGQFYEWYIPLLRNTSKGSLAKAFPSASQTSNDSSKRVDERVEALEQLLQRTKQQNEQLRSELAQRSTSESNKPSIEDVSSLNTIEKVSDEYIEELRYSVEQSDEIAQLYEEENNQLLNRIQELEELSMQTNNALANQVLSRGASQLIKQIIESCYPSVSVTNKSLKTINKTTDFADLFQALSDIHRRQKVLQSITNMGQPDVYEYRGGNRGHLRLQPNGAAQGRIYAKAIEDRFVVDFFIKQGQADQAASVARLSMV